MELPPEASNNIYEMTEAEREAAGIDSLPEDLYEAIKRVRDSRTSCARRLAITSATISCATSGPSGTSTRPSSPPTSSRATFPSSRQRHPAVCPAAERPPGFSCYCLLRRAGPICPLRLRFTAPPRTHGPIAPLDPRITTPDRLSPKNSIQNEVTPAGRDGRVRGKNAGSARSSATCATEDDASCRSVRTRRPRLHFESSCKGDHLGEPDLSVPAAFHGTPRTGGLIANGRGPTRVARCTIDRVDRREEEVRWTIGSPLLH